MKLYLTVWIVSLQIYSSKWLFKLMIISEKLQDKVVE